MINEEKIRKIIRKYLLEFEDIIDEERIANKDAKEFVKNKQNFLGTHLFGEKLISDEESKNNIDLNDDYAVFSYIKDFPIFIYNSKTETWYENGDDYYDNEGNTSKQTKKHIELTRPTSDTKLRTNKEMLMILKTIMKRNGVENISHEDRPPGTK